MSIDPRSLPIADYTYDLPDERIARYPLMHRDAAKLLVYKNGYLEEDIFRHLALKIPEGSTLVLNVAKVVRARMHFLKPTGGAIEIFCLEPHRRYADISTAMAQQGEVYWQCLVGGAAKWKDGMELSLQAGDVNLYAELHERNANDFTIHFRWNPQELSWAEVMETAGQVPLPPYLDRAAEESDVSSYQTLFAKEQGSVAAPTASLHFTPIVLNDLTELGVHTTEVTLHVGAGTFRPVKADVAGEHEMHAEQIEVSIETIAQLINSGPIVAAGTTVMRTLESLYWMGRKTFEQPDIEAGELAVGQWEPYHAPSELPARDALRALQAWMERAELSRLITRTEILIAPGYEFRVVNGLITNFHQPRSTLLLLVAAFIGEDWKRVYNYALDHDFRFLSYGDASLLWRRKN